jgi:hypothetical protein
MDFLPGLFHDKLTEDNREPFLTCMSLPRYDGCFDVYAPRLLFWIQLFYVSSRRNCWAKRKVNHGQTMVGHEFPPRKRKTNQRPESKDLNGHIMPSGTTTMRTDSEVNIYLCIEMKRMQCIYNIAVKRSYGCIRSQKAIN